MTPIIYSILKEKNFLSLAGNTITALLGLASFMILARTLNKELFGTWLLYLTAATFADMIRFGLTRSAIVRFLGGVHEENRDSWIGANYLINSLTTFIFIIICLSVKFLFPSTINNSIFFFFFCWYPFLTLANLPFNNALSIMQAEQRFDIVFIIKALNSVIFLLFLTINLLLLKLGLKEIVIAHIICSLIPSILSIVMKWDGVQKIFKN